MNEVFKDCYARADGASVIIGNGKIERRMTDFGLTALALEDKQNGHVYACSGDETVTLSVPFDIAKADVSYACCVSDKHGLSQSALFLKITYAHADGVLVREFAVTPGLPFIASRAWIKGAAGAGTRADGVNEAAFNGVESNYFKDKPGKVLFSDPDALDALPLAGGHLWLDAAQFFDQTDRNDYLVRESGQAIYHRGRARVDGGAFILTDKLKSVSLMLVKDAPTHLCALNRSNCDLIVEGNKCVQLVGSGIDRTVNAEEELPLYGSTVGVGRPAEMHALYRAFYRAQYRGNPDGRSFIMSNTWGDRSQDTAVCHDFMMGEADAGKAIGVDIMQIDDGWERGVTSNAKRATGGVWEGYYASDPNFWDVNLEKFPGDLTPVSRRASENGITMALWFSPDSSNDFANWEKDVETILALSEKYGVQYFKLDGVKIRNKLCEKRYLRFLDAVTERGGGKIFVNQDITAEQRLGYFYEKPYGTLFVENRYTDWVNYYPHNTLKNLWCLSKYIPSYKFQFELLNNRRNAALYAGDPLAPSTYDIDYEFAAVMLANPLVWMEMSRLPAEDIARLRAVVDGYKAHREAFFAADVSPIGQTPCGSGFTGFHVKVDAKSGYFLLFRELTEDTHFTYALGETFFGANTTVLISNGECAAVLDSGALRFTMSKPRGYALVKYQR